MKLPTLPRPNPETSGFNKRRIAVAGAVVVLTLGVVTFLLTRSSEDRIVRTEPAIGADSARPPRELLEEPPGSGDPSPPFLEPDLGPFFGREDPPEIPPPEEKEVSPRVQRAFSERITYNRRPVPPPSRDHRSPGTFPPELASAFEDLEKHNRALGEMLKQPPTALPIDALDDFKATLARDDGASLSRRPPETRHQQVRIHRPGGAFLLRQGTIIPAQLLTEINSDLPGQVLAHVSSDVRDSGSYTHVLLPRGTKLVGVYDSGLKTGQNRLAVVWTRLLLPGGGSIDTGGLPAVDAQGRTGLSDRVNHHTGRIFGNALLLSLLSAGFEVAQPSGDQLRLSAGELAVEGASRELERAATEILRRNSSIPPTVKIRAGTAFNVFLTGDLIFAAPRS